MTNDNDNESLEEAALRLKMPDVSELIRISKAISSAINGEDGELALAALAAILVGAAIQYGVSERQILNKIKITFEMNPLKTMGCTVRLGVLS